MRKTSLALAAMIGLAGCSSANLEETKAAACDRWKAIGYKCIGYEGYQWGAWLGGSYGGAHVWHTLKQDEAPGIIYTGNVQRWGDEYHIYGPTAVDAIKGQ
jgi:uncharacterized protein YceK